MNVERTWSERGEHEAVNRGVNSGKYSGNGPIYPTIHCFSCGCSYDIFDLVGMEYGLTESKAILEKVASMYNYQLQGGGQVYQNQSKTEQYTHKLLRDGG